MSLRDNVDQVKDGQPPAKHTQAKRDGTGADGSSQPTPKNKKAPAAKASRTKNGNGATVKVDRSLFCKYLIANKMDATAAYKQLCPDVKHRSATALGSRLLSEVDTIKALRPMLAKLFSDAGIEADYVFRRWLEIAEGSAADYFTFDKGIPKLDMTDLTPAQLRNLKAIKVTEHKHGTNYAIEVYCADHAVDMIAKHLGLLVDRLADEDVQRIGDLIERGVKRIKSSRDLDGWKDIELDAEFSEVR